MSSDLTGKKVKLVVETEIIFILTENQTVTNKILCKKKLSVKNAKLDLILEYARDKMILLSLNI